MTRRTNLRRIRPTEVAAVADLLVEESDDVEELAKAICRKINEMRAQEEHWIRVVRHGSGFLCYGPYRSAEAAREDDLSRGPSATDQAPEIRLWSLLPPFGQGSSE